MTSPTKYKGFRCGQPTAHKGNKKDTKRWCRGVVGREHQKEWKPYPEVPNHHHVWNNKTSFENWFVLLCTACGKEFDHCYFVRWRHDFKCKCGHHVADTHKDKS